MVAKLFIIFSIVLSSYINASIIQENVKNLVDENTYNKHHKLIKRLFYKEKKFLINEYTVAYEKILKVLKRNGLLQLFFPQKEHFSIQLNTNTENTLFFIKIIQDSLSKIGYDFVFTKSITKNNGKISWEIDFESEYTIDPLIFIKELNKSGCIVNKLSLNEGKNWIYNLDISRSFIQDIQTASIHKNIRLKDSKKEYLIKIENGQELTITSHRLNNWYPNIVFFDANLNIINFTKEDSMVNKISLQIPYNTKYIKIGDIYTKKNISRGLKVFIK
jgi:hypothetical protein